MDEFGKLSLREHEALRIARRERFWLHLAVWAAVSVFFVVVWALTAHGYPWFVFPIVAWAVPLTAHGAYALVLRDPQEILMLSEQTEPQA